MFRIGRGCVWAKAKGMRWTLKKERDPLLRKMQTFIYNLGTSSGSQVVYSPFFRRVFSGLYWVSLIRLGDTMGTLRSQGPLVDYFAYFCIYQRTHLSPSLFHWKTASLNHPQKYNFLFLSFWLHCGAQDCLWHLCSFLAGLRNAQGIKPELVTGEGSALSAVQSLQSRT